MATKPAPKPEPKPARKSEPRPAPKLAFRTAPRPAPIDLVRNPNFDAAMAQQNYNNFIAGQRARIDAERGNVPLTQSEIDKKYVDDGRGGRVLNAADAAKLALQFDQLRANNKSMDEIQDYGIDYIEGGQRYAPVNQGLQAGGGMGGGGQDFIDNRDPNRKYTADLVNYIDPATGEVTSRTRGVVPAPGSRFVPANKAGMYRDPRDPNTRYGGENPELKLPPQSPQEGGGMGGGIANPIPQDIQGDIQKFRNAALAGMGERMPTPIPEAPQGAMASQYPIPQGQQMQDYQNFLKQGMQNSNALNQGAMASFANTQPGMQVPQVPQAGAQIPQPGMQTPQPVIGQPNNPNMAVGVPFAGGIQRRQNPAQRKFSTFSNKPARFF